MDIMWIIFAVFLFIACAILLVLEIFVPSFGFITICAIVCLIAGGAIFFEYGQISGWIGIAVAAIVIPIVWILTYRFFPKTPVGKKLILGKPEGGRGDGIPDRRTLDELLMKKGIVRTPLRPVGTCEFDGQRVECVSERGYIDKDRLVQVIRVEGPQVTVRVVSEAKES
ncbi:MAG TPA: NfeD family protein [Anaerohalosphaeraceae bacterium]|jgi:membrane-bound serine protease (ClpP class)|nr:NfeD family protein [Anaerohalosphaeraceae bacterium]